MDAAVELRAGDVTGWKLGRKGKAATVSAGSTPEASIWGVVQ